jgi:hypothetical protein
MNMGAPYLVKNERDMGYPLSWWGESFERSLKEI